MSHLEDAEQYLEAADASVVLLDKYADVTPMHAIADALCRHTVALATMYGTLANAHLEMHYAEQIESRQAKAKRRIEKDDARVQASQSGSLPRFDRR